jgi:hypothetical protein
MVPEKVNVRTDKEGRYVARVDFGGPIYEWYRTDRCGRGLWLKKGNDWVKIINEFRLWIKSPAQLRRWIYSYGHELPTYGTYDERWGFKS